VDKAVDQLDALVIGAGPTGLTLAAQLHAFGITARLVDRQMDRVSESRALAVQPRTLELLRGLGLAQALRERGNDAIQLRMHVGQGVVPIRLFDIGSDDTAYPFLLFVSQAETEAILNQHLAERGLRVERGVELVDFAAGEDHVTCTLRDQGGGTEEVTARYLIGCDGAHSTVRTGAGIPFEGGAYPQTFALGDLEVDGELEPEAVHIFLGAEGMLFLFPLGTPATWRMMGMRPASLGPEGEQESTALSLQELQAISDSYTGGKLTLRDPAWLTYFRLHHRHAAHYRIGRVFLAGDAAHVHSPAGAQGMNTGIQDAGNLGWKLALVTRGIAAEALLDSYEAERWPIGRFVLHFTDRAFSIATSDSGIIRFLRTEVVPRVAPVALSFARGRAFVFRTVSQLGIHYRRSPAVEEGSPSMRRGPRAGDRLPDARIALDGNACWLQEALAAPRFHILLCGPRDAWDGGELSAMRERYADLLSVHHLSPHQAPGVLHDVNGQAFSRLGVEREAHYLVRPDGYIGFRGAGTDLGHLQRHLARWLPGATTSR
jgi:2-polyprenyl-6-methoxyphenol hydroxylase-like FAD-dependent oxidoreductase